MANPVNIQFPLWLFLTRPLFQPGHRAILNPWQFWHNYRVEQLERCWKQDYVQTLERVWRQKHQPRPSV